MGFLQNLFGKRGKEGDQGAMDVTTATGIETMLRAHMRRLDSAGQGHPGANDLRQLCMQLLEDDRLSFTIESIRERLPDAMATRTFSSTTRLFPEWCVAVTVCPWLLADDVRSHLGRGYPALLSELTDPAYAQPGGRHVAHWIYCSDGAQAGVHLTLVPNSKVVRTTAVIAEDLLTPDERRKLGLRP